ncbi:unnamed protein product [Cuscuta campestris]|uniref:LysM domain-containing protein n=1 Tax=Cuscuta campestris TaxID=132261 RepID=A0A484M0Y7_9ASTE|nr:unnamed protein product [Cuscuta campestris]
MFHLLVIGTAVLFAGIPLGVSKSTIEPCSSAAPCSALVGYTLYTDLKVSEVAALFNADPIALLLTNAIDISPPGVENLILPKDAFLKVPVTCSCIDGIFKSGSVKYTSRLSDTPDYIAATVYSGLVSGDQIKEGNPRAIGSDPSTLGVGTELWIPLPCTCFNGTDNNIPAIFMSYVVQETDSLPTIAGNYSTTVNDLTTYNNLGTNETEAGDVIAIPLPACPSNFPRYASDFALSVPSGSYSITAGRCVQCSCGPDSRNLRCMPASMEVSCTSMQCRNSNLMLGNVTAQQTPGGCNVTSCSYGGYVNNTIVTVLSSSLQPRCPGTQRLLPLLPLPSEAPKSSISPSPAPLVAGGAPEAATIPSSPTPSSTSAIAFPPTASSPSGISSSARSLQAHLSRLQIPLLFGLLVKRVISL